VNAIPGEDQTLTTLVNQSQSARGRLQAIQAGNQIAAQEVQQMQKLREMMNAQIQNESLYYAQKIQRQAVDDAAAASWSTPAVQQSAVKGY
jgi:P-type conjugative transfer protein TrbJ